MTANKPPTIVQIAWQKRVKCSFYLNIWWLQLNSTVKLQHYIWNESEKIRREKNAQKERETQKMP